MNPNEPSPSASTGPSPRSVSPKLIEFSDLRLSHPLAAQSLVWMEYEDRLGSRSMHRVSLTCTGEGGGSLYFGGYDDGKFSIFRADWIHRVTAVES